MFEALVERLLNQILGEYIENFNKQNLNIGIWSGQVILRNIQLKKDIIKKLNLPFLIKFSRLGCLKLNIPWKSLTSSKIQVLLEGLEIVLAEVPQAQWQCKNTKIIEKRKKQLQDYCEAVLSDFAKKAEKSKDSEEGYFSKLVVKIIDNLQVTIKDIHIRYEDHLTNEYSFGVTLEELKVYTVNQQNKPEYVDRGKPEYANEPLRKRLQLYNIGIYWNEKSQFYTEENYSQKLSGSIAKRGQTKFQHNYIILMTSQAQLKQRDPGKQFNEPEIDLAINLQTLKLQITNNQLQQIVTLGQRLQKYSREVKRHNTKKLSVKEKTVYTEEFMKLFPSYYQEWGKKCTAEEIKTIEDILEIMETDHFVKGMTKYLQDKEKQKIIEQKKEKNRGWFSKPKDLTNEEMKEIQSYLNQNFAQETSVVKRPKDYYHINVLFQLEKLEIIIANTLSIIKDGIKAELDQLAITFKLREGGYQMVLALEDIVVQLFKQAGVDPIQYTNVLYKIVPDQSEFRDSEYLKLEVMGSPLDKPHLNTDIKLMTSELMMVFYPKIIQTATSFADIKLSKQNKEAAMQKYGEYYQKTSNAVSNSIEKPTKQLIGADIFINSITVAVPLDPKHPNKECWGLSLGSINFTADQETLKRTQVSPKLPIDVYNLKMKAFSFRHYTNLQQLQLYRRRGIKPANQLQSIIDNLDYDITLQLYDKVDSQTPKIKVIANFPKISASLSKQLYSDVLKIGDCFVTEQQQKQERITSRIIQKSDIKQRASKIGMVFIKDNMTQVWKKYVAIMCDNYIYLYLTPKDENYYAYYYIKKATLEKVHEPLDKEKPYYFKIKNRLNQVTFGFDKPEQIDDWVTKIEKVSKEEETTQSLILEEEEEEAKKKEEKPKDHNSLTLQVEAKIQKIALTVHTTEDVHKNIIRMSLTGIYSQVFMHESKKIINLRLNSLQLSDILKKYKHPDLKYFLKTEHSKQIQSLVNVHILQLDKDHPDYSNVVSSIDVDFGKLTCNYKCETVKALMAFFIPPKDESASKAIQKKLSIEEIMPQLDSSTAGVFSFLLNLAPPAEVFSLKLNLKISEISVTLVNQKTKACIGKLGITELKLYNGISQKRMILIGSLKQLYYLDYSNYPNTILQELDNYKECQRALMKANLEQDKNMLEFNIEMLNEINQEGKKMLIDTRLNNLTMYYTQQPVLRLITYLNTQMLPSFDTGSKQQKVVEVKDTKPEPSPMDLKVDLQNISIFVEPNPLQKIKSQYIKLNIEQISVRNKVVFRDYVQGEAKSIMVENYKIILAGMGIEVMFYDSKGHKHEYELTNKLTFTCSTDLIVNPLYYAKEYKEKFKNGLRVQCNMTPFVMRINQRDYSFLMKCLNWSVTHDDGADSVLYDLPDQPKQPQKSQIENSKPPQKDPFYLTLTIDCLSLFIMSKGVPIAFLILDSMTYNLKQGESMYMDLKLQNIYGTSVSHNKQYQILTERGMFNAIGYQKTHQFKQKIRLVQDLFKLFDRRGERTSKIKQKPFLYFIMRMSEKQSYMSVDIDEIIVDIDIGMLLTLSTVAIADEVYIKGPEPVVAKQEVKKEIDIFDLILDQVEEAAEHEEESHLFEKIGELGSIQHGEQKMKKIDPETDEPAKVEKHESEHKQEEDLKQQQKPNKITKIQTTIGKIQGSVSDKKRRKFIVMEGEINFSMVDSGAKNVKELKRYFRNSDKKLQHTEMLVTLKDLSLYFCKAQNGQFINKRQILKPSRFFCQLRTYYEHIKGYYVQTTDINVITSKIAFFASMVDLLNLQLIMQDNLKALNQAKPAAGPQKQENRDKPVENDEKQKLKQWQREARKAIQQKMKLKGEIEPIQFELVNDCDNNFMPVLRLMIIDIKPFIDKFFIKNQTTVALVISLHFFNPRSSEWEPIIEPFKAALEYLVLDTLSGPTVKMIVQSKVNSEDPNDIGALKLNVSSQMLETVLAAKEVADHQLKKLQNEALAIFDFIMELGKEKVENQDAEVSPIILENITNEVIFLERADSEFQMNPLFKGPVKFDESMKIKFRLKGISYEYGMDHYGTLKIGGKKEIKEDDQQYYIQFDIAKLSRIIRFLPSQVIQNKLYKAIFIRRVGNVPNVPKKIDVGEYVPLDSIESFSVSISGTSYTNQVLVSDIGALKPLTQKETSKFTLLWSYTPSVNRYDVYELHAPFIIHNCLPKQMEIQYIMKASTKHTKTIPNQSSHEVCASESIWKLDFRINIAGYGWSKLFRYNPEQDGAERVLTIEDENGSTTHINYVLERMKNIQQYVLTIYCKKLVINQLRDKLIVYGNSAVNQRQKKRDKYLLLGGQQKNVKEQEDKVVLIGDEVGNKLRICGVNSIFDFATQILIGGIGESTSRIIVDRQINGKMQSVFTIVGVEITLMKMSPNCDIFCKKIRIKSKGIIVNNTPRNLIIKEERATTFESIVPAGQKQCSVFSLPELNLKDDEGYTIQSEGFQKSRVFHLPQSGSTFFQLLKLQKKEEKPMIEEQPQQKGDKDVKIEEREVAYHKINVQSVQGYKFYEITEIKENELPYEIRIKSPKLTVVLQEQDRVITHDKPYFFYNQSHKNEKFSLTLLINHQISKNSLIMKVFPDDLNFKKLEDIELDGQYMKGTVKVDVHIHFSDKTKTIVVDMTQIAEQQKKENREISYMEMKLPQIVISVNQNSHSVQHPYESLVITLKRIIFIKDETENTTIYQLKLGFLQIDQAFPHITSNPVIITPNKFQLFTKEEKPESVFNSMITINNSFKENTFIDAISVDFNDIVVKFSLDFLNLVTQVSKEFAEIMNYENKSYYVSKEIEKWREIEIPKEGRKTFIKSINISPFYIDLSAELNLKKLGLQNNQLLNTLLSAIGVVVSNIEDAPIRLSGMSISDCIDTSEGLTQKIISQYKGDVINQFYKIFGSLNIIGNPMGLLRNISAGFEDFTKKPAKGFVEGPAEFGKGIIQGTGSLVAHSVGGAFNSVSKITGTVSTGLAALSFDQEFEEYREKEKMKKPKNVLQGLQKGGKAVLHGFKEGITGLFTQPYENARKEGLLGLVKGAGKGLAGLVIKPVTGVIDFASKTTEGIKNNALIFQDRANEDRMRYPRVFYTECHIMREYEKIDSQILYILMKAKNDGKFDECTFIDCFPAEDGLNYVVILNEYIVYVEVTKKKVEWELAMGEFECSENKKKESLHLRRLKKGGFFQSNQYDVPMKSAEDRQAVIELVARIVKEKIQSK